METEPDLTLAEFGANTNTSLSSVKRGVKAGTIPSYRVGALVRIPRRYLDALRAGEA